MYDIHKHIHRKNRNKDLKARISEKTHDETDSRRDQNSAPCGTLIKFPFCMTELPVSSLEFFSSRS